MRRPVPFFYIIHREFSQSWSGSWSETDWKDCSLSFNRRRAYGRTRGLRKMWGVLPGRQRTITFTVPPEGDFLSIEIHDMTQGEGI